MSFCFGFYSNDSALVHCTLEPFTAPLTLEQGAPHGWGLAYYQVGRPLLKKQPKPLKGPLDFASAAVRLRSNLVLGHARGGVSGGQCTENTQPFRYRDWTFCHSGQTQRFDAVRPDLLKSVPDHIRRSIRGKTDSEHIFFLFLSFLNDTGKMDDPRIPPAEAARALGATFSYLERLVKDQGGDPIEACCLTTNGSFLMGMGLGMPLKVSRQSQFSCKDDQGRPLAASHLKAVAIVGGQPPDSPGWETVADRSVVTVDPDLNIEIVTPE